MKSYESTGKTIEDAVENGLRIMNLTKADVDIKILNKGNWFSKAKVLITVNDNFIENLEENEEKTEKTQENQLNLAKNLQNSNEEKFVEESSFASHRILEGQKNQENITKEQPKHLYTKQINQNGIQSAIKFLNGLFEKMNIEAEIETIDEEMNTILEVRTNQASILIGKHGDTMYAIQNILNIFLNSNKYEEDNLKKILIDVENYRQKQDEKIIEKAKMAIETCIQKAKPVSLDYMNAYERHLVHELVLQDGRVLSESFGKEPRRFVKIFIK